MNLEEIRKVINEYRATLGDDIYDINKKLACADIELQFINILQND